MMQERLKLKNIENQVIVITGASSGIGLATAQMAAKKGAKLVLASRNTEDLERIVSDIRRDGGDAIAVTVDVTNFEDMDRLGSQAIEKYGRIDTWVNNAGVSIYGEVFDTPLEEAKKLFETNFWGVHYGCRVAVAAMKNNEAGMIINLGSEVSERAIALQTFYSASKHAVAGYTEGLRTELEKDGIPIGLTLVRPAAIDTPYTQHASNHLKTGEPSLPAPVYHPDVAARAILACAESGKRDVYIGGAAKLFTVLEHTFPRLVDAIVESGMFNNQRQGSQLPHTDSFEGLMQAPEHEGQVQGGHKGHVAKTSLFTNTSLHPFRNTLAVAGLAAAAYVVYGIVKEDATAYSQGKAGAKTPNPIYQ